MPPPKTGTDWLRRQIGKVSEGGELPVTAPAAATVEVEAWLQSHGVRYSPPAAIPMAMIDEKRSRTNQARRDPIVADSVERFAAALRTGAVFPPIVTYPHLGKLVIIDGNNRQAAHRKAGKDAINGVIIAEDTPSELIQLLTVEANAHHGVTPETSWRVQQAFHLCSLGFSDPAAAEAAAISVNQLRAARAVQEADQRARSLRVSGFTDLAQATRQSLNVLRDDAVFYQAAKTAVDTSMTIDEVRDMVRAVKGLPSEGARIEYIGGVAKDRGIERATRKAVGRQNSRVSSPKQSLVTSVGKFLAIDEAALVRQVLTAHDRDQITRRLGEMERKLAKIRLAMGTLGDFEVD